MRNTSIKIAIDWDWLILIWMSILKPIFLPNVNQRWTFWSIMDNAINLFTSEVWWFLWIAAMPLLTILTTFGNAHAHIGVTLVSRRSPNLRPESDHHYSSMLLLFRELIMSPVILFTSSPTCFAGTSSTAIHFINMKDFFAASATSNNPPFFPVAIR